MDRNFFERVIDEIEDTLVGFLPDLAIGFFIALTGWIVARIVSRLIVRAADRRGWDEIVWGYWATLARYLILAITLIAALSKTGFPVSSLLLTFGITGAIVGFGARTSMQNYFAGMMMLSARPFKIGDLVEFGVPPQLGTITHVALTHTGMTTLDNVKLVVPNSVMWGNKIFNFSTYDLRAIRIPMVMPYDVDVDWVKDISFDVLKRHESVLDDPAPRFMVADVTAENVKVTLVAWSKVESMTLFGSVVTALRKDFEAATLPVTVPAADIDLRREE